MHEARHGVYSLFDGHLRIHAVQIVKVDSVGFEPTQRVLAGPRDILRPPFHLPPLGPRLAAQVAELGREYDGRALSFERLGEDLFVVPVVMISGVNEIDADINGATQNGSRLFLVRLAQVSLKRRTTVADGRYLQAFFSEKTVLHKMDSFSPLDPYRSIASIEQTLATAPSRFAFAVLRLISRLYSDRVSISLKIGKLRRAARSRWLTLHWTAFGIKSTG